MKNLTKTMTVLAVMLVGTTAFAGPHGTRHHHHGNDGLALAAGIVNLVARVIAPAPVVAVPAPAVVTPPVQVVYTDPVTVAPPAPVVYAPAPVVQYRYTVPRNHYHRPAPPRHHRPAPAHRPGRR